ncbi:MAG: RES family NAD+ phosphorylase [Candidatus Thiodiazotropha sp. (ex Dulcina madagascariensis)]|nr:RES family NAD+ phosphorylase [Candidatus Thiodiazotropha sp. (ex Dulcina madagascariensis)]
MRVWRVCRKPFASLDGKGSELKGGRWHSPGQPVVYASEHLSLAILEVLVHLEVDFEDLPDDYVSVEIDIPDNMKAEVFNADIDIYNITETRDYGDMWLTSAQTGVLNVPSAVVPNERNVCLSTKHPDFKTIRTVGIEPFQFDPRLFELG